MNVTILDIVKILCEATIDIDPGLEMISGGTHDGTTIVNKIYLAKKILDLFTHKCASKDCDNPLPPVPRYANDSICKDCWNKVVENIEDTIDESAIKLASGATDKMLQDLLDDPNMNVSVSNEEAEYYLDHGEHCQEVKDRIEHEK